MPDAPQQSRQGERATPYTVAELRFRLGQFDCDLPVVFAYQGLRGAFAADTKTVETWDDVRSATLEREVPDDPESFEAVVIRD